MRQDDSANASPLVTVTSTLLVAGKKARQAELWPTGAGDTGVAGAQVARLSQIGRFCSSSGCEQAGAHLNSMQQPPRAVLRLVDRAVAQVATAEVDGRLARDFVVAPLLLGHLGAGGKSRGGHAARVVLQQRVDHLHPPRIPTSFE